MDVIVKGQPSIEVKMEAKVVDSYKTADAALSESSVNPVQNKVVTTELNKKATKAELSALETKVTENKTATDAALSDLNEALMEQEKSIADLDKTKADTTGYYPQMSVGQADNLPDRGDVLEGFIGFRESAGAGNSIEDGTANVQELLGESLVWNQKVQLRNADLSTSLNGVTITDNRDGSFTVVTEATGATADVEFRMSELGFWNGGHKYCVLGGPAGGSESTYYMRDAQFSTYYLVDYGQGRVFIAPNSNGMRPVIVVKSGTIITTPITFRPRYHDLTQMFGAGYEPSTIEEFNAIKNQLVGVDFNAYNEGEVLGVNIKGIKSVNDNAWDEKWEGGSLSSTTGLPTDSASTIRAKDFIKVLPSSDYYVTAPTEIQGNIRLYFYDADKNFIERGFDINEVFTTPANAHYMKLVVSSATTYNHDICIRLAHSGYKTDYVAHEESESSFDLTKYFPNGMHGLNGVRDSATPKKATRRFGVEDMGNLTFTEWQDGMYAANLADMAIRGQILCAKYNTDTYTNVTAKTMGVASLTDKGGIVLYDSAYTTPSAIKASLQGVMLIYELTTPIETEIDPQLNMNYKVWDFGTEELLTDSKSAPVLARTIYGFNATDTIRGNKATNEEQDARLHTLESEVVRKGDYSPDNSVGFADDLVGRGESVPAEFSFRASGGKSIKDGAARIKRLKGNSVVWNQPLDLSSRTITHNGVTFTVKDDGSVVANGTATDFSYIALCSAFKTLSSHKYFIVGTPTGGSQGTYYFGNGVRLNDVTGDGIIASGEDAPNTYACRVLKGVTVENVVFRPQFHDLTQMFGAGNEPTTIEEFYARKPIVEDEYAYNEGEVIHMTAEGIKSVGDNAWDEEWEVGTITEGGGIDYPSTLYSRTRGYVKVIGGERYAITSPSQKIVYLYYYDGNENFVSAKWLDQTLNGYIVTIPSNCQYMRFIFSGTTYNNDIMITLVHSGWKQDTDAGYQPYWEDGLIFDQRIKDEFPDGMKSAGTAHDVAYNDMNKGVGVTETRIGVVDMGDLPWYMSNGRFVCDFPNGTAVADGLIRGLCAKYVCVSASEVYNNLDKAMFVGASGWFNPNVSLVIVNDTSYTDAATFKAAMAGVMLYYELAEPTIIEYDEPFNLDYKVADFGTEQAIAEQPSAPISADIIYQFNAVDMIREHELEIAELQSIIATMQAQLASLTSNNE